MTRRTLLAALMVAAFAAPSDAASPKRGWGGSNAQDHNASNSSWYYRWWHTIPPDAAGSLAEFVPLIKFPTAQNLPNNLSSIASLPNVDTLLVLNEPERDTQSDRTVAEALSYWPTIQSTLPNHRLVGPGIGDDMGGRAWLTDFMNQRAVLNSNADPNDDIRLDALAFHWYGASEPNPVQAANTFMNRVQTFHNDYGLPVWITEFAMHDWEGNNVTEEMIAANAEFLEIVLPQLDALEYVERYAYYNWFEDAHVWVDDPRRLPRVDPNVPNPPPTDRMPTVIGDVLVETTRAGEVRDLAGQSVGTDIGYLRGGEITNTGSALPEAMRAIDALEGLNTISGSTDWSLSARRDNFTRVRGGATLRKEGSNTVELTGLLRLEGRLEVAEGVLRVTGGSPGDEGGSIRVEAGGTLALDLGRSVFTVGGPDFHTEGVVDGPIRFLGETVAVAAGAAPHFTSDVTVQSATLDVGGPGFTVATPTVGPVTDSLLLEYNAAADNPDDNRWDEASDPVAALTFAGAASPVVVSDPSLPGVSAAYSIGSTGGAEGLNGFFDAGVQLSQDDATFEFVFRVDDTSAGADQVIFETGGAGRGVALVLNNDTLLFNVDGFDGDLNLTTPVTTGWRHVVGVIDLTPADDTMTLYLDGQVVGSLSGNEIADWAGGNIAGLGAGANSVTGVSSGVGAEYHGAIALARFYERVAFDAADAEQNYLALATAPQFDPTIVTIDGSLTVDAGGELRLDLGAAGAAEKVIVAGDLDANAATLTVGSTADAAPAVGDAYDLFDFATASLDFASVSMPGLEEGLSWRLDRLAVDGVVEVVVAGDFNGDGVVDAADYTLWRDASGTPVLAYTAGDATGDGAVNGDDYAIWQANFGATAAAFAAAVPEPTTVGMAALLTVSLPRRRR